ncbi:MAG TPA: hypothetical protein VFG10_11765 [Saprospiraceae bacterium]|nr:hypothetical protein [Saprospiraceae bacterium]
MNKFWSIPITGVFLLCLFFSRCKNDSGSESSSPHLLQLDTIRDKYNVPREQKDWTMITQGNVNITVQEDRITIDHLPEAGFELVTYFLQGATKNYDLKTDSLGRCEVLFLGRNLIVHSFKEKKPLLFTVRDLSVPSYLKNFTDAKQYIGYGLGARKFERNGLHDNVPFCLCEKLGTPSDNCRIGNDGGAHGCASGTPDGSCEVSCSESAYACCDKKME